MNIIFIGMRGTGKSTVGLALSKCLGMPFIETDREIEKRVGMSISEFISLRGWNAFRMMESSVIEGLRSLDNTIISSGGGTVLNFKNIEIFQSNGIVIWLTASLETMYQRTKDDDQRPFLTNAATRREDIRDTLKIRESLYKSASQLMISTDTDGVSHCIKSITKFLNIYEKHR
jgi:shikimate kinase